MSLPELMTVAEFAKYARVTEKTVRRSCQNGSLPAIRVGGCWRIVVEKALETARK